jgi:mannosyltransferase
MEKQSYHQMCRWNSGMFSQHSALKDVQYYWRVEPSVHFFCDVDYDVFRWMQDHNKTYGFNINIYDSPESVATLWPETRRFLDDHPSYLHPNNAREWLEDEKRRPENTQKAHGYSTCHFWSNFEIGDLTFWRSKKYRDYFNHLDRAGGFFYERWGDAPSIAWHSACLKIRAKYTGSETLGTNTCRSSIAQTIRNVQAASPAALLMARTGSNAKTAGHCGSSM